MRKAASIARGAWSETSEPSIELMSRLKLMSPRPIVTGSISTKTRWTRGSRKSKLTCEAEADAASTRQRHRELHDRADQDADRVGVELLVAARGAVARRPGRTMITTFQTSGRAPGS